MRTSKVLITLSLIVFFSFSLYAQDGPQDGRAHYERANLLYEQARYEEAQEEYRKALSLIEQERDKADAAKEDQNIVSEKIPVQEEKSDSSQPLQYTLTEGDILHVLVEQQEYLSREIVVRLDGMISFPFVGDILAVGLTISQLDEELTERLKEYITYPEVSITIKRK